MDRSVVATLIQLTESWLLFTPNSYAHTYVLVRLDTFNDS